MRAALALLLTVALASAPGCTRNNYLQNRGGDFVDIFRARLMAGPGIGAKVDFTRLTQIGALYGHRLFSFGLHNRAIGLWRETVWTWGLLAGYHSEQDVNPIDSYTGSYGWNFANPEGATRGAFTRGSTLDLFTVRVSAMFMIGADVEIRFGEAFDFVAGIFAWDPAGDDLNYEDMKRSDLGDEDGADEAGADDGAVADDGAAAD